MTEEESLFDREPLTLEENIHAMIKEFGNQYTPPLSDKQKKMKQTLEFLMKAKDLLDRKKAPVDGRKVIVWDQENEVPVMVDVDKEKRK